MTHPATAPTLPWPAIWPARPPTTAPLMHPFASAAAGARAIPRTAVQIISDFIVDLLKTFDATIPLRVFSSREHLRRDSRGSADGLADTQQYPNCKRSCGMSISEAHEAVTSHSAGSLQGPALNRSRR